MGWWQVSADTLAGSRFAISALAETTASLMTLEGGTAGHPGERAWLHAHRRAYRERLASDPVTRLLVRAALRHRWVAGLVAPAPPGDGEPAFDEELARVRQTPPEIARAELTESLGRPLPAALQQADLAGRAADLLQWVWAETVQPYWPRRRQIIEADVVARSARLSQGGWAKALSGLRPEMRWLGQGRLQINAQDYPPREISGAQLLFVPVTPRRSWAAWDIPHRYALIFPCAGVLAEPQGAAVPEALGALLGPARARVLVLLDTPKSTSQLVALTGQGLGSVGRHLKVLLGAGLIGQRRAGRSVLYYRTHAGEVLLAARPQPPGQGPAGGWRRCPGW